MFSVLVCSKNLFISKSFHQTQQKKKRYNIRIMSVFKTPATASRWPECPFVFFYVTLHLHKIFLNFSTPQSTYINIYNFYLKYTFFLTAKVSPGSCSVLRCAGVDTDPRAFCGPLAPRPWTHSWVSWREVYSSGIRSLSRALVPRTSRTPLGPERRHLVYTQGTFHHLRSPVSCPNRRAGILDHRSLSARTEHRSRTRPGTWNCLYPMDCMAGHRHTCHAPPSFLTLFVQSFGNENSDVATEVQAFTKLASALLRALRQSKFL